MDTPPWANITDPEERARVAARAWADADARVKAARAARDAAALHLLRNEGRKPVEIYRPARLSRRLFQPIAASCKGRAPVVEDAERVLVDQGEAFWYAKAAAAEAAHARTAACQEMLSAGRTNAEVARASGLSTARVTQIKKDLVPV